MRPLLWIPLLLSGVEIASPLSVQEEVYREEQFYIFDNPHFGRVFLEQGAVHTTEKDGPVYHEMVAHVPLIAHGSAKRVLILGGGDGGILQEVLRHPKIEAVCLVEPNRQLVELSKRFLPFLAGRAFSDPRVQLRTQSVETFVRETDERFDVIIADLPLPSGAFYGDCKKRLNQNGILVAKGGSPFLNQEGFVAAHQHQAPHFRHLTYFTLSLPTHLGGPLAFSFASEKRYRVSDAILHERIHQLKGGGLRYYNAEVHKASFALPQFFKELLARSTEPLTPGKK
jgi:spermidine synthase